MFDFSFAELMLAGVIALIVLGPERLPTVARKAGEWLGKVQQLAAGVKGELTQHTQVNELVKIKNDLQNTATDIKQELHDFGEKVQEQTNSVAQKITSPAWERLPEQKTPADFGIDEMGQALPFTPTAWQTRTLAKQAMIRKKDHRPRHRPTPKLRSRK